MSSNEFHILFKGKEMKLLMKTYKDFDQKYIGNSDIATLIMVGYSKDNGLITEALHLGGDDVYSAYIVTEESKIGDHYSKIATFSEWMKIYDDTGLSYKAEGKEINVYRAGMYGCIIQIIQ